jgi:hypothetical protein
MKMEHSVLKRWYIKFRRREITQKKAYNIQNKVKVWNHESRSLVKKYIIVNLMITVWICWLELQKFHHMLRNSISDAWATRDLPILDETFVFQLLAPNVNGHRLCWALSAASKNLMLLSSHWIYLHKLDNTKRPFVCKQYTVTARERD